LGVVDYLVKPFSPERVDQCVRRLAAQRRAAPAASERPPSARFVARRQRALVFLELEEVWACEASERLTYVHSMRGRFELDLALAAIGASFGRALVRVHRNWLVNAARVLELDRAAGEMTLFVGTASDAGRKGVLVPVSKDRAPAVR